MIYKIKKWGFLLTTTNYISLHFCKYLSNRSKPHYICSERKWLYINDIDKCSECSEQNGLAYARAPERVRAYVGAREREKGVFTTKKGGQA